MISNTSNGETSHRTLSRLQLMQCIFSHCIVITKYFISFLNTSNMIALRMTNNFCLQSSCIFWRYNVFLDFTIKDNLYNFPFTQNLVCNNISHSSSTLNVLTSSCCTLSLSLWRCLRLRIIKKQHYGPVALLLWLDNKNKVQDMLEVLSYCHCSYPSPLS